MPGGDGWSDADAVNADPVIKGERAVGPYSRGLRSVGGGWGDGES